VGQAAVEAAAAAGQQLVVSTKNRLGGFLVAVRGWQDQSTIKAGEGGPNPCQGQQQL
jgi:hypothetical protein